MRKERKDTYARQLIDGNLSLKAIEGILDFISRRGMKVEKIPEELLKQSKIAGNIKRQGLYICSGNRSWEGLVVGFPGDRHELSTENLGTPYLRFILYPILNLYGLVRKQSPRAMPCLYLLGERFNDVFLRKFSFFNSLVPTVIVFTDDLRKCALRSIPEKAPSKKAEQINEYYIQKSLCDQMLFNNGLTLPVTSEESIKIGLISYEVPTVASTKNPERLDILGYDMDDHSLIAFELKGPHAGTNELQNLFLQGMEHRNWLEENKMAVKFAFDGPNGKRINVRKRVKLVLGFCGDKVPPLFFDLKAQALRRDRHLQIEFCRFITPSRLGGMVKVGSFAL